MTKMFEVHELKIFERNSKEFVRVPRYVVILNDVAYETDDFASLFSCYPKKNLDEYFYHVYDLKTIFYVSYDNLQENFEDLIKSIKNKSPEILL